METGRDLSANAIEQYWKRARVLLHRELVFGRNDAKRMFPKPAPVTPDYLLAGLSKTPRILYVSDCIFLPSRLTGQINFALSPLKSA